MHILHSLFILLAIVLTSCGYRLRGQLSWPQGIDAITIVNQSDDLNWHRSFAQLTAQQGIDFSFAHESSDHQDYQVILTNSQLNKTPISFSVNGQVSQYSLNYTLTSEWRTHTDQQTVSLTVSRILNFNSDQISAKRSEERMLLNEMRLELANNTLSHWSRFTQSSTLNLPE